MDFDTYKASSGLNWSALRQIATSPLMYRYRLEHPLEATPAMALGTAVHAAVLQPDIFETTYRVAEQTQCSATTKAGAQCSKGAVPGGTLCAQHGGAAEVEALGAEGITILSADDGETVARCVEAIQRHGAARSMLAMCPEREVSLTWAYPGPAGAGRLCKGRLDAIGQDTVIDLKTTRDLAAFERSIA